MQFSKNKTMAPLTALFLALTIAVSALPFFSLAANAAETEVEVNAFLAAVPNPVGVNQGVTITVFLLPIPPAANQIFHGLRVTITKPGGSVQTVGPLDTTTIGATGFVFTPDTIGNYTLKLTYPGETIIGIHYKPAESPTTELIVQQEPIAPLPEVPLPTDYWTRPISAENRDWYRIAGNWLTRPYNATYKAITDSLAAFNPYSTAPRSSHIVWTREQAIGGLVGGDYGYASYYSGESYERNAAMIIINGRLYYHVYVSTSGVQRLVCVDLRTGEEYWERGLYVQGFVMASSHGQNAVTAGQLYNFQSGNQAGVIPYLWTTGTTWDMYDAFTGDLICSFANATAAPSRGTGLVFGQDGTMYYYILNADKGWLAMWNSTKAFAANGMVPAYAPGNLLWRPMPGVYDWRKGIEWNTTITAIPNRVVESGNATVGSLTPLTIASASIQGISGNVIVAFYGYGVNNTVHMGYDTRTGKELWIFDRAASTTGAHAYPHFSAFGEGLYAQFDSAQMNWVAYDLNTGLKKWISDKQDYPWGAYMGNSLGGLFVYGKLYSMGYDGMVHAFETSTGKQLWKFYTGNSGIETPYGSWPLYGGPLIADNVLFANNGEHSPTMPLYKGQKLFAIDATTGEHIWNITGMLVLQAIADGYVLAINEYDNEIYCFGKGPSATTVTASPEVSVNGESVLIKGTVIDQCAGAKALAEKMGYINGVPAIADESMSSWMEYLYMQKPIPTDATGVEVTLDTIDPNGNFVHIGTATSDAAGMFKKAFVPEVPGEYTIIATFPGSNSYGSSYAETAINVEETPPATGAPEYPQPIDPTWTIVGGVIAIIIAVAIVGLLILRKK